MKKFFYLLVLLSSTSPLFAQLSIDDIIFERELIDFGTIRSTGGVVTASYRFVNTSQFTFIINDIDVACGCTTPRSYKKMIPPGDTGRIEAVFNPKGILGNVTKWIHIKGNFKDAHWKELKFKAEITDKQLFKDENSNTYYRGQYGYLLFREQYLRFGTQSMGFTAVDSVEVYNDGYVDHQILSVSGLPSYLEVTNLPLTVGKSSSAYIQFRINTESLDTMGLIGGLLQFETNDRFFQKKELHYSIELKQDFSKLSRRQRRRAPHISVDRMTVDMGSMSSGQLRTRPLTISNTGKSDLRIYRVDEDCSCAVLDHIPSHILPGESITVDVRFDALYKSGLQRKGITLYTNDPEQSELIITVAAVVE